MTKDNTVYKWIDPVTGGWQLGRPALATTWVGNLDVFCDVHTGRPMQVAKDITVFPYVVPQDYK